MIITAPNKISCRLVNIRFTTEWDGRTLTIKEETYNDKKFDINNSISAPSTLRGTRPSALEVF